MDICVSAKIQKDRPKLPLRTVASSLENMSCGAPSGTRTRDTLIKSQVRSSESRQ